MVSAYLPRVHSEDPRDGGGGPRDHRGIDNTLPDPMKEVERSQPENGEEDCRRGRWLGGTMVSDGLGERYGS